MSRGVKKSKKEMSILMKEFMNHGLLGIVWCIIGIYNLFDLPKVFVVFLCVLLVVAIIVQFGTMFAKTEVMDEMAQLHETKSYSKVLTELMLVLSIIGAYSLITDKLIINLKLLFPFIISLFNILIFFHFWWLEKVGD